MDDPRYSMGLLDMSEAARFPGIPRLKLRRWAFGYAHGDPLLHVVDAEGRREAQVTFIVMTGDHGNSLTGR